MLIMLYQFNSKRPGALTKDQPCPGTYIQAPKTDFRCHVHENPEITKNSLKLSLDLSFFYKRSTPGILGSKV